MRILLYFMVLRSLLLGGAIFGFFYAWVCSTMWGLDAADPFVAIAFGPVLQKFPAGHVLFLG